MSWISRAELNDEKWNQLRLNTQNASVFSSLTYLDAVAQDCMFFVVGDYAAALACPFFERLGVKTLYTPVFCRYIEWLGDDSLVPNDLKNQLQEQFKEADIYIKSDLLGGGESLVFQELNSLALNTQAKRKVKKARTNKGWELRWEVPLDAALERIENSLMGKFATLKKEDFNTLRSLCRDLDEQHVLEVVGLYEKNYLQGALIFIREVGRTLYLKGASSQDVKQKGGMYFMMESGIKEALARGDVFDFGGSRIEGVRKFNFSFGGKDYGYFRYSWSNGPIVYRILKKLKNKWRKK